MHRRHEYISLVEETTVSFGSMPSYTASSVLFVGDHNGKQSVATSLFEAKSFMLCLTPQTRVLGNVVALCAHLVRTACTYRETSPKITYHPSDSSTAEQQSPQDKNETAFKLVLQCTYEQTTQPYKVQLCSGMQDCITRTVATQLATNTG